MSHEKKPFPSTLAEAKLLDHIETFELLEQFGLPAFNEKGHTYYPGYEYSNHEQHFIDSQKAQEEEKNKL